MVPKLINSLSLWNFQVHFRIKKYHYCTLLNQLRMSTSTNVIPAHCRLIPKSEIIWDSLRLLCTSTGRDRVVSITTRYGLDGPGIETRWRSDFPHKSRPALVHTQPPIQRTPGLIPGRRFVALTTHPHLMPRLKKEYSYNSTPLLGLYGML